MKGKCTKCNSTDSKVIKIIMSNGLPQFKLMCQSCGRLGMQPIAKKKLIKTGYKLEEMPIYRSNVDEATQCGVKGCNEHGVELHHYSPSHLFDDSNDWPTGFLCMKHHIEWHKKTVTGMFYNRRQL